MEMKTIYLDCREMITKHPAHEYLKRMLSLPSYYGNNLDALYDCLAEISAHVVFTNAEGLCSSKNYAASVISVFKEAADSSKNLSFEISEFDS